jgi:hypothetical protein
VLRLLIQPGIASPRYARRWYYRAGYLGTAVVLPP